MTLPKELEELRNKKVWLNFPMIWRPCGHDGQGAYSKPPINPYTLENASTTDPATWSDFETANNNIGKNCIFTDSDGTKKEYEIMGVGIALYESGIYGLDLDSVVRVNEDGSRQWTTEAGAIVKEMNSYTEISPSQTGIHILFTGGLDIPNIKYSSGGKSSICDPCFKNSGKYEIYKSGRYLTITGDNFPDKPLRDCTETFKDVYKKYFVGASDQDEPQPIKAPSVVSNTPYEWLELWRKKRDEMNDDELLKAIFDSPKVGPQVRALYGGDMSAYNNGHSESDQALITFLYCFTEDDRRTDALFRSSRLYRAKWERASYRRLTLAKAHKSYAPLSGHIDLTADEKRDFAQRKGYEEFKTKHPGEKASFDEWLKISRREYAQKKQAQETSRRNESEWERALKEYAKRRKAAT